MSEWKKKPVVIEAFQWCNCEKQEKLPEWMEQALSSKDAYIVGEGTHEVGMMIKTLEGEMKASVDDYIIRGVKGELYPCKPDIFEMTYDKAPVTFLDRLKVEMHELDDRITKLSKALNEKTVPEEEMDILKIQLGVMISYSNTLQIRINRAENK